MSQPGLDNIKSNSFLCAITFDIMATLISEACGEFRAVYMNIFHESYTNNGKHMALNKYC